MASHIAGSRMPSITGATVPREVRDFLARRAHAQDREDLMQEVALRLHQHGTAEPIESRAGFAVRIARNVLIDRWRRDKARQRERHVSLEEFHHPVEDISPARVLEGQETLAMVLRSLGDLPERTRQAFILHRFEDMSYAAIAAHLDVSVSAVEKHISKAVRHLSAQLGA